MPVVARPVRHLQLLAAPVSALPAALSSLPSSQSTAHPSASIYNLASEFAVDVDFKGSQSIFVRLPAHSFPHNADFTGRFNKTTDTSECLAPLALAKGVLDTLSMAERWVAL